jgi:ABC-2 type transport system ATP-binding protein
MPETLLKLDGVRKSFHGQMALADISLAVDAGEIVGFIGPNGAGKTTTIKIISSLTFADAGSITIAGHQLRGPGSEARAARAALGLAPDRPHLYDKLTAREYILFVAGLYQVTRTDALRHLESMAHRFQMTDYLDRPIESMSHGMKQKTALSAALVHAPPVFVCDEPLVGLDPHGARQFRGLLADLRHQGRAVLMSSHSLDLVEQVCDRVIIISRGRAIGEGTVSEIKTRARLSGALEEVFLQMIAEDTPERV